jgi:hypothetical protein
MRFTIKSRKLGREIEFSRPGGHYVYVDLDGKHPGTLGHQICEGGGLMGSTITYEGDDEAGFARICRNWWKKYIKNYDPDWDRPFTEQEREEIEEMFG